MSRAVFLSPLHIGASPTLRAGSCSFPKSTCRRPIQEGKIAKSTCRSASGRSKRSFFGTLNQGLRRKGFQSFTSTEKNTYNGPDSAENARQLRSNTAHPPFSQDWSSGLKEQWGKILYSYFNWRQDTWNDLQLFVVLNLILLGLGASLRNVLDIALGEENGSNGVRTAWQNIYEVLVIVFGQELPDTAASATLQAFSLIVAAVGLASFALVLALVEQEAHIWPDDGRSIKDVFSRTMVVLQVLDANVRQGGQVFEEGHILVLSLADNQRDQEVIWKILSQVCLAYRNDCKKGSKCVVVLCQREKLQMESDFRRILPEERRFGARFVFRQGLPMIPDDLRQVAASKASATIVISDSSRSPEEADAQAVRVAVLLDELDFPGLDAPDTRTGHIVVEVKTPDALELVQYSCSSRVIALPTSTMNAHRIARIACQPVVGMVSQQLWSFNSESQGYLQPIDGLEGRRLSQVHRMFPTGLVLGIYNRKTEQTMLNPPAARRLKAGDYLVMMRPTSIATEDYRHTDEPVAIDLGGWDATSYVQQSHDEAPDAVSGSHDDLARQAGLSGQPRVMGRPGLANTNQCRGLYMLPLEYTMSSDEPERVLICGWGNSTFMLDLLRALDEELPTGSEVTLFNMRINDAIVGAVKAEAELTQIEVVGARGDPLKMQQLRHRLDVTAYKCAIILCDQSWLDPDLNLTNGIALKSQSDMLRLDALVMAVQLNIRKLLEESGYPDINLVCEKLAFEGVTRFEDRHRMPMGICVNLTAYAAKLCFQAAYNPMIIGPYRAFGTATEWTVQDASDFSADGEELSFWQMQARCLAVSQTLLGSFLIPTTVDRPLEMTVNPWGVDERSRQFVWNMGDNRRKLITLTNKADRHKFHGHLPPGGGIHEGAFWSDGRGRLVRPPQPAGEIQPLLLGALIIPKVEARRWPDPARPDQAALKPGSLYLEELLSQMAREKNCTVQSETCGGFAGSVEMGHLVNANNIQPHAGKKGNGKGNKGLTWVSEVAPDRDFSRSLKRSTSSVLREQEIYGHSEVSYESRLLDELAFKRDHLPRGLKRD